MFGQAQQGGALDYTGYHERTLDEALRLARTASPVEARAAWSRVDAVLTASAPVAWLYHARGIQGRSNRLGGVVMDLRGELVSVANWSRP
jgi:peptide/nickel transport system substrate-binding protein